MKIPPPRTSISKVNLCFNLPFILILTKKLTQKTTKSEVKNTANGTHICHKKGKKTNSR